MNWKLFLGTLLLVAGAAVTGIAVPEWLYRSHRIGVTAYLLLGCLMPPALILLAGLAATLPGKRELRQLERQLDRLDRL